MMKAMLGALAAATLAASAPQGASVDDLAWMSGRWETSSDGRWTEEQWSAPRGGVMLGYSRSGEGEALREFEFLRLQAGEDGAVAYMASPTGRPPVAFRLTQSDGSSATFENPAHDFPQRIRYRRQGDDMVATISTIDGGNAMSWTYRRRP